MEYNKIIYEEVNCDTLYAYVYMKWTTENSWKLKLDGTL